MDWNADLWKPLIQEREFLSWLVVVPSPDEMARTCRQVYLKDSVVYCVFIVNLP